MKISLTMAAAVIGLLAWNSAQASTLVSTIDGGYDGTVYDTPYLTISNTTAYDFTGVTLTLQGYQGINNGLIQSRTLPTIAAGSSYTYSWTEGYGGVIPGDLFSYDYDDEYGQTTTNPDCILGQSLCSYVGNFQTTFDATWLNPAYGVSGTEISSVFTPSNNASGGFVGWEGLDPNGLSETTYDDHSGTPNGVLANIYVGAPVSVVPEPSTWAMFLLGFGGIGFMLRNFRPKGGVAIA